MKTSLHVVTNSEVEDWDRCHAYWGFRYAELLRPREEAPSIGYGDLYHEGCRAGWHAAWLDPGLPLARRREHACAAAMMAVRELAQAKLYELGLVTEAQAATDQEAELWQQTREHIEIAQWALFHYFQQPTTRLDNVPLAIEATFSVAIPTRVGVGGMLWQSGKMDLVLWDREAAQIILEDHKTTGYAVQAYEGKLALLTQPTGYLRALHTMLERAHGEGWWPQAPGTGFWGNTTQAVRAIMELERKEILASEMGQIAFNVSRRAKPKQPDVNQLRVAKGILAVTPRLAALMAAQEADGVPRGEVSAAEIDTLPEVYEAALVEQETARGLPRTDKQRARLELLRGKASSFFQRHEFYRGPGESERWRQEMWVKARQIREAHRDPRQRTRNPYACTGPGTPKCLYAAVCLSPEDPVARSAFRVASVPHEELDDAGHRTSAPEPGTPAGG